MNRPYILPIILVVLACGLSRDARAIDTKIYPGTFCRQVGGAGDTIPNGPLLVNTSSSPIEVSCPILRDDASSIVGWDGIEIFVRDVSPTAAIECWGYTRYPDGTVVFTHSDATGIAETTPGQTLWEELTLTGGGPNSAVPNGTYGVMCNLPGGFGNGIGGYRVVEP